MAFSTLDELATWMLTNIRLSRYDQQFINNLTLYATQHNRVTTNQDQLFKKVALKYNRQFSHFKINIDHELTKSWTVGIVESTPEHTGANIKIEDGKIIFRSPFNRNFLTALKKESLNSLVWIKNKRQYEAEYSVNILKRLIYLSADHYEILNYCPIVTHILNSLSAYENAKYWTPTLCYKNGYYYIAALNEPLYEAIKNIPITDDLKCISTLVSYGITVHQDIIDRFSETEPREKINLAARFHSTFEIKQSKLLVEWLHELGCDAICNPRPFISSAFMENTKVTIQNKNIEKLSEVSECSKYEKPVVFYIRNSIDFADNDRKPAKLFKLIKLVNSEPVIIR